MPRPVQQKCDVIFLIWTGDAPQIKSRHDVNGYDWPIKARRREGSSLGGASLQDTYLTDAQ